ncbi:hypothetical protein MN608_11699 [Microdochium nivale]|nr:hypothetical protein MN608_11699 [Microdochium nivale]
MVPLMRSEHNKIPAADGTTRLAPRQDCLGSSAIRLDREAARGSRRSVPGTPSRQFRSPPTEAKIWAKMLRRRDPEWRDGVTEGSIVGTRHCRLADPQAAAPLLLACS